MPDGSQTARTMWGYALKMDVQMFCCTIQVTTGRPRHWLQGNSFTRNKNVIVSRSPPTPFFAYTAGTSTAQLNATLEIPQYVQAVEGFPWNGS
ncbi:hypothetical protein CCR75_005212 [Bremia lactucae]|uniref:Uncharacterized protein n=1 Tax=Bremia lactucae TaxID=4779 RepID=A0A976FG39_BRELC|nr:hypothetical protein CCR75_005212 [Bremia lactucae]